MLLLDIAKEEYFAGKLHDYPPVTGGGDEGVVLFGGNAGHGLEPVGIVGGTLFQRPVLHGFGNGVGSFQLQLCAGIDAGAPGVIDLGGEALAHGGLVEDITAENLGDVDYRVHHLPSFRRYQNGLNTHFYTDSYVEKSINKLTLGALLRGAMVLPENRIL